MRLRARSWTASQRHGITYRKLEHPLASTAKVLRTFPRALEVINFKDTWKFSSTPLGERKIAITAIFLVRRFVTYLFWKVEKWNLRRFESNLKQKFSASRLLIATETVNLRDGWFRLQPACAQIQ